MFNTRPNKKNDAVNAQVTILSSITPFHLPTTRTPQPQSPQPCLTAVPHPRNLGIPHLPLQLENTIHQRLTRRRATRHVDVDRHDPVATPHHRVTIVVVPAAVGAAAHG